ncbi:hypothetical protein CPB83DRAFT_865230 [Crepidotus variabilis]|uniref:Uncharacterized protein n=1 Tax=Crepidotus variabilis TaxID=179855 RepID=A0A9P6E3D7_9AGAR|nr:hypothetical protein CPB83DRAFT_865230 [Crepidotus variabilis]
MYYNSLEAYVYKRTTSRKSFLTSFFQPHRWQIQVLKFLKVLYFSYLVSQRIRRTVLIGAGDPLIISLMIAMVHLSPSLPLTRQHLRLPCVTLEVNLQ